MNLDLEKEYSKAPIIAEVDALKKQIDDMRPLPPDIEGRVMQKLRLDWNYNSNAIEGNKLNYGETVAFLMTGITAKGKPLKDYLDIKGHNEAINFLLSIVKDTRPLTEADIRALHKMILVEPYEVDAQTTAGKLTKKLITVGQYKTQANHVQTATGETHYYTTPEETPAKMQEMMEWYQETINDKFIHPIVTAALFHHKFVEIHPFDDGNGRLSRMLMNLILMQNNYPPAVIKMDDRQNYYALLSQADVGQKWPFVEYIFERVENSLQLYLKAANGGDVDEDEDIDKEIALFKMEVEKNTNIKEKKTEVTVRKVLIEQLMPLVKEIISKIIEFDSLFFVSNKSCLLYYSNILTSNLVYNIKFDSKNKNQSIPIERFNSAKFVYSLSEFRNLKNLFEVQSSFILEFKEYNYLLYDANNIIVRSYTYDEPIPKSDQRKVIKSIISKTKDEILKHLN